MSEGWSDRARHAIAAARQEGERRGLAGKDLLKFIDAAYPFGPRSMWPHKAWLKARRQFCGDLPGVKPLAVKRPGEPSKPEPMPGQLDFLAHATAPQDDDDRLDPGQFPKD